jgi:hypothetical protein
MATAVEGFGKMVWRVVEYHGLKPVSEQTIPQDVLSEHDAKRLLQYLACRHLTPSEIVEGFLGKAPHFEILADTQHGNRLTWSIGSNPHYVIALFRADEIPR